MAQASMNCATMHFLAESYQMSFRRVVNKLDKSPPLYNLLIKFEVQSVIFLMKISHPTLQRHLLTRSSLTF
jgi:hypothetical protein